MIKQIFSYLWNGPKTEVDGPTAKFVYIWRFFVVLALADAIHITVLIWQNGIVDFPLQVDSPLNDRATLELLFSLFICFVGWLLHTRRWEWGAILLFGFLSVNFHLETLLTSGASVVGIGFQLSLLIGISYFYDLRTTIKVSILTIIVFAATVLGHELIKQIDSFVPRPDLPWVDLFLVALSAGHALLVVHITKYEAGLVQQLVVQKNVELKANQEHLELQAGNLKIALLQAEDASLAKSAFFAHMSHELRTPLNAIIGYGELVEEQLQEVSYMPETILDTQRIQLAGKHLLKIIDSILNLNRIEKNEVNIRLEKIQLGPMLTELEMLMLPLLAENQNSFEVSVAEEDGFEAGGMVHADGQLLLQVLINLISNATKFTQGGAIRLVIRKRGRMVRFQIVDNGIGIDEEFLPYIFEPFSQEEKGLSRKFQGAGLGMAISREMVSQMNGTISAANNKNGGATFEVLLPLFAV